MDLFGIGGDMTIEGSIKLRHMNSDDTLDLWLYAGNWNDALNQAKDLRSFADELRMFADKFEDEARFQLAPQEKLDV